jgi:hypothetical protein
MVRSVKPYTPGIPTPIMFKKHVSNPYSSRQICALALKRHAVRILYPHLSIEPDPEDALNAYSPFNSERKNAIAMGRGPRPGAGVRLQPMPWDGGVPNEGGARTVAPPRLPKVRRIAQNMKKRKPSSLYCNGVPTASSQKCNISRI